MDRETEGGLKKGKGAGDGAFHQSGDNINIVEAYLSDGAQENFSWSNFGRRRAGTDKKNATSGRSKRDDLLKDQLSSEKLGPANDSPVRSNNRQGDACVFTRKTVGGGGRGKRCGVEGEHVIYRGGGKGLLR